MTKTADKVQGQSLCHQLKNKGKETVCFRLLTMEIEDQ